MLCLEHDEFEAPIRYINSYLVISTIYGSEIREMTRALDYGFENHSNKDVSRNRKNDGIQ